MFIESVETIEFVESIESAVFIYSAASVGCQGIQKTVLIGCLGILCVYVCLFPSLFRFEFQVSICFCWQN